MVLVLTAALVELRNNLSVVAEISSSSETLAFPAVRTTSPPTEAETPSAASA